MPTELPSREGMYLADPESPTELARLMNQDRLVTRFMEGAFLEPLDFSNIHDILDLACGPGGWVLDVAHSHPKINVVGIDISQIVVQYARAQARSQGLDNAK